MRTLPLVYFSASSLNFSAPLPLGVSAATTWLNLITIGCCWAPAGATSRVRAATAPNSATNFLIMRLLVVPQRAGVCAFVSGVMPLLWQKACHWHWSFVYEEPGRRLPGESA